MLCNYSLFMLRFHSRKFQAIFDVIYTGNDDVHSHDTIQGFHLHVPMPKAYLVKMSVCYIGATRWNYCIKFLGTYCRMDIYKKG